MFINLGNKLYLVTNSIQELQGKDLIFFFDFKIVQKEYSS